MIMEMLSAFGFSYGLTKYLNEDFFMLNKLLKEIILIVSLSM